MLRATVGATIGAWPPAVKGTAGSVTNAALQLSQGPLGGPESLMTRNVDDQIDAVISERGSPPAFVPLDTSAWVAPFEARLPYKLPPSFSSLIRRYRFPPFESGGVTLFGNVNGTDPDDLVVRIFRDAILASVTQRSGLIQVGQPSNLSYDPVCFDLRARTKTGDAPLVRLDHEEILINSRIKITQQICDSFLALLA